MGHAFAIDDRQRRFALVIEKYPPFIGGAERQAQLLARLLSARLGSFHVFTAQADARPDPPTGRIHRLGTSRRIGLRHPINLLAAWREFMVRSHHYSVVHVYGLSGLACGAIVGASARGCATIVKLCSVGPEGDVAKVTRHPFGRLLWPIVRRLAVFVVPSPPLVSEVIAAGVPPHRIAVIPNALPPEAAASSGIVSRVAARAELGLPERLTVLFVGRLAREKGLDVLARAWDRFAADHDATLVVVGDGVEADFLADWVRRSGHEDRVRLTGARSDVERFYQAADVLVVPSRSETFCNVLAEGMAHGLAVVSTPVGLAAHWIRSGENGLLVRGEDVRGMAGAIRRVARDAPLRARLGAAARRDALAAFDADAITLQYVDLYERLIVGAGLQVAV